jgi:hypothetical protein
MATAIETAIERQQVEYIYGLTGGELNDSPLRYWSEDDSEGFCRYHYDGVPEWATEDFKDANCRNVDYFTTINIDNPYGWFAQSMRMADGRVYHLVKTYASGGEAECPCSSSGCDEKVGEGCTKGYVECPLCEATEGEDHGMIYLGTGSEAVYKHVEFECAECSETRADCVIGYVGETYTDLFGMCSCDDSNPEA